MNNLTNLTPIELQHLGNEIKVEHDSLKNEMILDFNELELLENKINSKILRLQEIEEYYVAIVEKLMDNGQTDNTEK